MANKLVTDRGKTELLRLGFVDDDSRGAFNYLALGSGDSKGVMHRNSTSRSGRHICFELFVHTKVLLSLSYSFTCYVIDSSSLQSSNCEESKRHQTQPLYIV